MDTIHYKILKELYPHGVGKTISLSELLLELFPVGNTYDYNEIHLNYSKMVDVLHEMIKDELIAIKNNDYRSLGVGNLTNGYTWFHNTIIEGHLRTKGLELYEKEESKKDAARLTQSVIDTNSAVTKASNSTDNLNSKLPKFNIWQIGLATGNLLVAGAICYYTATSTGTADEIRTLNTQSTINTKELEYQKQLMQSYQKEIDEMKKFVDSTKAARASNSTKD